MVGYVQFDVVDVGVVFGFGKQQVQVVVFGCFLKFGLFVGIDVVVYVGDCVLYVLGVGQGCCYVGEVEDDGVDGGDFVDVYDGFLLWFRMKVLLLVWIVGRFDGLIVKLKN